MRGRANLTLLSAILLLALMLLRVATLGLSPLLDPSEGRYSEIARVMLESRNWFIPTVDGAPFWSKPPLHFTFTALSFKVLGLSDFAARLPSFLGAVVLVLVAFRIARGLYGIKAAFGTAVLLASTAAVFFIAGFVLTEMTLAACVALAMLCLIRFVETRFRLWAHLFFVFVGFGMLAKGPVALALCLTALGIAAGLTRSLKWLGEIPWLSGAMIMSAIFVPWLIYVESKTPGFLRYYVINEHLYRYVKSNYGDRYGPNHPFPRGTILAFWLIAALPWSPIYVQRIYNAVRERLVRPARGVDVETIVLGWALACPLFYSFASNVVITYVLPSLPACAILCAKVTRRHLNWAFSFGVLALIAAQIGLFANQKEFALSSGIVVAWGLLSVLLILIYTGARDRMMHWGVTCLLLPLVCVYFSGPVAEDVGEHASAKTLVSTLKLISKDRPIFFYDSPPFSADFYLRGRLTCLHRSPGLLDSKLRARQNFVVVINKQDLPYIAPGVLNKLRNVASAEDNLIFVNSACLDASWPARCIASEYEHANSDRK